MRRIAITGGLAEGKSTVLGYLADLGFSVLSADALAREVFFEPQVQAGLALLLGCQAPVQPNVVRQAIAAKPELRRALNRLMHPRLLPKLMETPVDFMEVPLLIETCMQGMFDEVWVVTCGTEEQLRRLTERLGSAEAKDLLATQLNTRAKLPFADVIVRTNEPEASVLTHVRNQAVEVIA